jgi:hypothetical protein
MAILVDQEPELKCVVFTPSPLRKVVIQDHIAFKKMFVRSTGFSRAFSARHYPPEGGTTNFLFLEGYRSTTHSADASHHR